MLGNRPEAADRTQTALNYKQLNITTKERTNFKERRASIIRQESHTQVGGRDGACWSERFVTGRHPWMCSPGQHESPNDAPTPAIHPKRHPPTTPPHHTQTHTRPPR